MNQIDIWIRDELPVFLKASEIVELVVAHPSSYNAIKRAGPYPDWWRFEWSENVGKPLVFENASSYYQSQAYMQRS